MSNKSTGQRAWERITKNIATTVLGVLVIGFCGVMVYTERSTVVEMSGWFTLGLGLLRSKNSLIGFANPK